MGTPFHGLEAPEPLPFVHMADTRQFVLGHLARADARELVPRGAGALERALRLCRGVHDEDTEIHRHVLVGRYGRRELPVAHGAIEARRATGGRGRWRRHRGAARRDARRAACAIPRRSRRARCRRSIRAAGSRAAAVRRATVARHRRVGQRAVQPFHVAHRLISIDIADDREHRIGRPVVVAVEAVHMLARERAKAGLAPDAPAAHAMPVVQHLVQRLRGDGVRGVRLALRLLDDDLDLAGQLVGVDERVGVRVGLDVEPCGEARRRQHRVVARVVVDRCRR